MGLLRGIFASLLISALASQSASACSVVMPRNLPSDGEQERRLRRFLDESTVAVIDGEVVVVPNSAEAGWVYAHHVWRGTEQRWYRVGSDVHDSCAISPQRVGERSRMVLLSARQPDDPQLVVIDGTTDSDRVDRIIGSNRQRDYPYFAGPRQ